ncbi:MULTISPECIES: glycine betaine ABC transporter substrate-binding protein [unclassified Janthinobacterium]|uniref:glycine betaine ABC transporter substrate-binding protein n=1 Tax=unclassified Janthinobacterium TaxID=2610881 RepID=UPI00160BD3D2|nr:MULTISPECIES: glycine betaine ABC transporter substrate-binding protein [unclassified Janthinobacterium]MBB5369940.1 osmoprotectant transport system substrate-binding protein [Janthinobacterium sp. K2C7]MBB5382746.1 osmoprotectant transport system substrate-binding protein [Janthinobacterium sp. K2Li3]MBB5384731.1 osmoprotectant transport system substrate-binding protein [Janthinobacterium sp. K2E3]
MASITSRAKLMLALITMALSCAAAGAAPAAADAGITIGSKIDTEASLLCPMVRLALEANGIKVKEKCGTGATQVVRKALLEGEIDVYPEYSGNAPYLIKNVKFEPGIFKDGAKGYAAGARADLEHNQIVWLKPAPASVSYGLAVPQKLAKAENLVTLADLARYINAGKTFKVVVSQEFVDRDDGLKAFEKVYGFKLKPAQLIILPGGNTAQTETAAAQGISGANAAMAYTTDGQLPALGLVALTDNAGAVDVSQPLLTIRSAALKRYPRIPAIIDPIFATLDVATLSRLNAKIVVGGQSGAKVAEQYLKQKGFLK